MTYCLGLDVATSRASWEPEDGISVEDETGTTICERDHERGIEIHIEIEFLVSNKLFSTDMYSKIATM